VLLYLVSVVAIFGIVYYFDDVMANVASSRSLDNTVYPILPDIGFEVVPEMSDINLVDAFDFILIGILLFYVLHLPTPLLVISQAMILNTMTNLLRITTVASTSFPDPRKGCERITGNPFTSVSLHRCGDDMFSGHSAIYAAVAVVFFTYGRNVAHSPAARIVHLAIRLVVLAGAIAGSLVVLSNRTHYTIDVLIAWYITIGAWYVQLWWWEKVGSRIKSLDRLRWPQGRRWKGVDGWIIEKEPSSNDSGEAAMETVIGLNAIGSECERRQLTIGGVWGV